MHTCALSYLYTPSHRYKHKRTRARECVLCQFLCVCVIYGEITHLLCERARFQIAAPRGQLSPIAPCACERFGDMHTVCACQKGACTFRARARARLP